MKLSLAGERYVLRSSPVTPARRIAVQIHARIRNSGRAVVKYLGAAGLMVQSGRVTPVAAGRLSIADVLAKTASDETVKKTKVLALVKAMPGIGAVRAAQILTELSIADTRRIGGLGGNQREALISLSVA